MYTYASNSIIYPLANEFDKKTRVEMSNPIVIYIYKVL